MVNLGVIVVSGWTAFLWVIMPTRALFKSSAVKLITHARNATDRSFEYLLGEYKEEDLPPNIFLKKKDESLVESDVGEVVFLDLLSPEPTPVQDRKPAEKFESIQLGELDKRPEYEMINVKPWMKATYASTRYNFGRASLLTLAQPHHRTPHNVF